MTKTTKAKRVKKPSALDAKEQKFVEAVGAQNAEDVRAPVAAPPKIGGLESGLALLADAIQPGAPKSCPHCGHKFPAPKYAGNEPRGFRRHVEWCAKATPDQRKRAVDAWAKDEAKEAKESPAEMLNRFLKADAPTPAPARKDGPSSAVQQAFPGLPTAATVQAHARDMADLMDEEEARMKGGRETGKGAARRAPPPPRTMEEIADAMPPPPASSEQRAVIQLEADRELALRRFDRTCEKMWKDYGVPLPALEREMTTDKEVVEITGDKIRHIGYKQVGLGVTLIAHLDKQRGKMRRAADPLALSEALRKAEETALNVALYLWAEGRAQGPATAGALSKAAKKAESLADSLEKMGKPANAQQQRERAFRLQQQADRAAQGLDVDRSEIAGGVTGPVSREARAEAVAAEPRFCLCGCGAGTKGNFRPGHDSKVHGLAKKIARGQTQERLPMGAVEYVKNSKWLEGKEREQFLAAHGVKP